MMTTNIGGLDRMLRIVAGVVLLVLGAVGPLGWWGLVGLVPLGTALIGFCPVYPILGINTCPAKNRAA